jgi:hypothetical protein
MRALKATAPSQMGGYGSAPPPFLSPGPSPLVASYNEWTSGHAYGQQQALPREWMQFLGGMFGPLSPIGPVPVDLPPAGEGHSQPRRWQYPVGWDMPQAAPGTEGIGKLADFQTLRTLADLYSVARSCINLRKSELRGVGWDIAPTKHASKAMRGDHKGMAEFAARRAEAVRFFRRPDPNYSDFTAWFDAVLEEMLVTDALSIYIHPSRLHGKGLFGSDVAALDLIDGSLVRPLVNVRGERPPPPNVAFQQYLHGVPRVDLMTLILDEDTDDKGLAAEYSDSQLMYLPYTPRVWSPYGQAPVERAIMPIMAGLRKQQWVLNYFDDRSVPGMFVSPGDPNMTPNQLRELQDALNAVATDQSWQHKIIVLPGGSKVDPQKPLTLADAFDNVIMIQTCCVPGTKVMTRRGLVAIEDVRVGDRVMTHRGRWRAVSKTMSNPVHAPVRKITAKGLAPLEVTGNHPIWSARYSQSRTHRQSYEETRWIAASDARPKDTGGEFDALTLPLPVTGSADARLRIMDHVRRRKWVLDPGDGLLKIAGRCNPIPGEVPMNAALGRLLGFYMAEGCTGAGQVTWAFHEDEVAYQQQVLDDLSAVFGLTAKITPMFNEKCVRVECSSVLLAELFSCGTAQSKKLPEWAWDGSAEFYASLLWGWSAGDGTLTPSGWRGYTTSETLAWQMRMVALACGLESQLRAQRQTQSEIDGRKIQGSDTIYVLQVVRKQERRGTYRIDGPHLTSPVRSNELSDYTGHVVYNLEVEDDNSYVTTGGVCHNCMAFDVMPFELGIMPEVSTTVASGAARQMATAAQDIQERKSTVPLLLFLKMAIFDRIIQDVCGMHDMEWQWEGLEEDEDSKLLTDLLVEQLGAGLCSIDEARQELGRDPWGLPITSDPGWATQWGGFVPLTGISTATANPQGGAPAPGNAPPAPKPPGAGQPADLEEPGDIRHTGAPSLPAGAGAGVPRNRATRSTRRDQAAGITGRQQEAANARPTPAHEADMANARAESGLAGTRRPVRKSAGAERELSLLKSHLRRGGNLAAWEPRDIPAQVLELLSEDLGKGLTADQACDIAAGLLPEAAGEVTAGHGHGDDTEHVYAYLTRQYPASVLGWVRKARWRGPVTVSLSDIDMGRRPGGARSEQRVAQIAADASAGQHLHPVVLVDTPGGGKYKIADGWHRTLGLKHAGKTQVSAWIGEVDEADGPWDGQMNRERIPLAKSAQD